MSTNKKYLQKQVQDLNTVKNNIQFKEQKIVELDKESFDVEREVDKVKEKYEEIVGLKENYKVKNLCVILTPDLVNCTWCLIINKLFWFINLYLYYSP